MYAGTALPCDEGDDDDEEDDDDDAVVRSDDDNDNERIERNAQREKVEMKMSY